MDYEKKYKEALERAKNLHKDAIDMRENLRAKQCEIIFPELAENEDEKIRKKLLALIEWSKSYAASGITTDEAKEMIAWLEKHGNTNETINRDEFAQGVLRGAAINLITWIDYNTAKGNMCLSNMECKVIEDALVSGDWDKIYAYIKRKLEKQGKSNFEQSIQDGDNVVTNEDGTHFNVSQLERIAKKVTDTKETAKEFLKSAKIMDENDELADEYRHEKQGEQEEPQVYETEDGEVITYSESEGYKVVEPKFKEGDWIVTPANKVFQITSIEGTSYKFDNESHYWEICYCDEQCRLWTIQDAKDGDVLATPNYIYIFNSIYKEIETVAFYCLMKKSDEHFSFGDYKIQDEILNSIPATKEQRDLLFKKMKEAGYEWDAEKKELMKIEQNMELTDFESALFTAFSDAWQQYLGGKEVNVAQWAKEHSTELLEVERKEHVEWSEEDENRFSNLVWLIEHSNESKATKEGFIKFINNLKSLKDRVQPQPQKKWTEEDEKILNRIRINSSSVEDILWLKSLKERMKGE